MSHTATLDDIDLLYEDTKTLKEAHKRTVGKKVIKVRSSVEVAKDSYKQAKDIHRGRIKALKRNIRTHRLMIRQARNTYKLVKLSK